MTDQTTGSGQVEATLEVFRSVWIMDGDLVDLDEDCSPTKSCRNMKDVTFDGLAEPGSDLGAAWRERLAPRRQAEHVGRVDPRSGPRSGRIA